MAKLSTKDRKNLSPSDFVFPNKAPKSGSYPINDREHAIDALARSSGKKAHAKVVAAVKRKFPDIKVKKAEELRKAEIAYEKAWGRAEKNVETAKALLDRVGASFSPIAKGDQVDIRVPLWKDDAKQIVYGVVLVPDQVDSQGDVVSKAEIEKAAHSFLVRSRKHDVQHSDQPAQVETVESYVAPQDMEVGGQKVVKGSWVMAVHVSDPDVWQKVQKRDLDGFSIGGTGERIPIAA